MNILGISAYYHDSAAALLVDGKIVAAAQEERFTRKKHDKRFPYHSIQYCLRQAGLTMDNVDYVAFYDKPFLKFERLLETYMAFAPRGLKSFAIALPVWVKEKLFQKDDLVKKFRKMAPNHNWSKKILFAEHHQSHAASAFYPSPWEKALVLTMDGVGEWTTSSVAIGEGHKLELIKEIHFPHSIGLLYSAFTYYTGFKVNSGEYKVMGLAPYGEPEFVDLIYRELIDVKEDGTFRLNMKYFDFCTGLTMTNKKFDKLFGGPARDPNKDELTQKHMNLAASIQVVLEEILIKLARSLRQEYGIENLCLAGGVALNCVANGKLLRSGIFDNLWIQPAAGDAGGALGAALTVYHHHLNQPRSADGRHDAMNGAYLGPEFSQQEIETELTKLGARFEVYDEAELLEKTAQALADNKAIGWHQGRMEFGPRALGSRSIIADAHSSDMQKNLNLKVKFRESFRPFAPAVLAEDVSDWFEIDRESPYMLLVADVKKDKQKQMNEQDGKLFGIDKLNIVRSEIPAVTHVDYSARVQTIHQETNPLLHKLVSRFKDKTGRPVIVNTSFNVRGEPIVCNPADSFRCFMGTDLDVLAIGRCLLLKEQQDPALKATYYQKFELD